MYRYLLVLLIFGMAVGCMFAAEGDEHSFELQWQSDGESCRLSESLDREDPFDKEPELGQNEIFRGALDYHGQTNDNRSVGFIWDKSQGKLYVDFNKDGDLTNDPNGIVEAEGSRNDFFQNFPVFELSFSTENGICRYQVTANMQGYDFYRHADFRIRSGYSGKIELYGRQWVFGVNDRFKGSVGHDSNFSVFPTEKDSTNRISSLTVPKSLFFDGRCYEVAFEFRKTDSGYPALWCTLTEKDVSLGTLRIEGKYVNQLVLGHDEMLVLPSLSEETCNVPAKHLSVEQCSIKFDQNKPTASPRGNMPVVVSSENKEMLLKIGGPLSNSVDIERSGKVLTFNYELVGVGGETYDAQQISMYNDAKKPSVAIYKGDLKLGGGEFEYG